MSRSAGASSPPRSTSRRSRPLNSGCRVGAAPSGRSAELEEDYKRLEAEKERADAALTQQTRKKMGINTEEKQLLSQTAEAERFSALQREKVRAPAVAHPREALWTLNRRSRARAHAQLELERDLVMWRLYHLEAQIKEHQTELEQLRTNFKKDDAAQVRPARPPSPRVSTAADRLHVRGPRKNSRRMSRRGARSRASSTKSCSRSRRA